MRPRVTVGLPVYNGERFLCETVRSILQQTFSDFELIISDNASTDATGEIARSFESSDGRVRYQRHPRNLGLAANFNSLLPIAKGEYFKWATADDPLEPELLARCVAILDVDRQAVLAYSSPRFVDERGDTLDIEDAGFPLDFEPAAARLRYVVQAAGWVNAFLGLIRSEALRTTRLFPAYQGGDYVLLGELCLQGRFIEIADPLIRRRIHAAASSQIAKDPQVILEYIRGARGVSLQTWSLLRGHARTILGAKLPARDKLDLLGVLLKKAWWGRTVLTAELRAAMRVATSRVNDA